MSARMRADDDRTYRLSEALMAQNAIEYAREFEAQARDALQAGFPEVAEEALAEARESRQSAATHRRRASRQGG